MKLTIGPREILQIDDARIIFRNFSGIASKYNREGDRNFAVLINDQDIADNLTADGWNVKIKEPRDEGDLPLMFLPVKVKFNDRGPNIYLESGRNKIKLDEESVSCLDNIDIFSVSLDVRPYDWKLDSGLSGRSAYLHAMCVVQETDRFADAGCTPDDMPF